MVLSWYIYSWWSHLGVNTADVFILVFIQLIVPPWYIYCWWFHLGINTADGSIMAYIHLMVLLYLGLYTANGSILVYMQLKAHLGIYIYSWWSQLVTYTADASTLLHTVQLVDPSWYLYLQLMVPSCHVYRHGFWSPGSCDTVDPHYLDYNFYIYLYAECVVIFMKQCQMSQF